MTNTNRSRTYHGLYLGPTDNIKGNLKMFDLKTGVVKNTRIATASTMPDRVI